MMRSSVLALLAVIYFMGPATADEKEEALKKDLAALKGFWLSPKTKEGDKQVRRTLSLGKGSLLLVVREVRSEKEVIAQNEKNTETTALSGVEQKGDKRVLKFVGFKDGQYEVEYELKGDKLKLKGSVAGIDLTGEWLREKGKWTESAREPLTGHINSIVQLAFSANGRTLASCSIDQTIRIWNVATGKEEAKLVGHDDEVYCLAFGPGDKTLITGGNDKTIRTWDLETAKETQKLDIDAPVWGLAFTRDGKRIVAGGKDGTVTVFDAKSGKVLHKLDATPRSRVNHVAVSGDGKTLVVEVQLMDEADKQTGEELRFYDLETVEQKHVRKEVGKYLHIMELFSADGKRMVYTRGDLRFDNGIDNAVDVAVLDAEGKKELARLRGGFKAGLQGAVFSPNGDTVVVICGSDANVSFWDVETERRINSFKHGPGGKYRGLLAVAVHPSGRLVATAGESGDIRFWELRAE
jgi:WD40 repeat protein